MTPAIADCWYRAPLAPRLSDFYYIVFMENCQIIFNSIRDVDHTFGYCSHQGFATEGVNSNYFCDKHLRQN